jgi:hypothetical protein
MEDLKKVMTKKQERVLLPNKRKGIADTIKVTSTLTEISQLVWQERDLGKAKQLITDHISQTKINNTSKTKILMAVSSITNKQRLDFYVANSLLNFERLGVN